MKRLSQFVVSSTLLLSCWFLTETAIATEDVTVSPNRGLLRRKRATTKSGETNNNNDSTDHFSLISHKRTIPHWVLQRISYDSIRKFIRDNDLKDDVDLNYQQIPVGAPMMKFDGQWIYIGEADLIHKEIMAKSFRIKIDSGRGRRLSTKSPHIFTSAQNPDTILSFSKDRRLLEVSRKSTVVGHDVRVVRLCAHHNIYVELRPSSFDPEKLGGKSVEDAWVPPHDQEDPPSDRENRMLLEPIAPITLDIDNKLFDEEFLNRNRDRKLQTCTTYKVVKLGVYGDSYFCDLAKADSEDPEDRAAMIVAKASQLYEMFCIKLQIIDIWVDCDSATDAMYESVSAASGTICTGTILDKFRAMVSGTGKAALNGDIVHLFSGRQFSGNRCVGQAWVSTLCREDGYQTGINEMTSKSSDLLLAHEAGHNMGAYHAESGIMYSSVFCGEDCTFSAASQANITAVVNSKTSCISSVAADGSTFNTESEPESLCQDDTTWVSPIWKCNGTPCSCTWLKNSAAFSTYCDTYPNVFKPCKHTCDACT